MTEKVNNYYVSCTANKVVFFFLSVPNDVIGVNVNSQELCNDNIFFQIYEGTQFVTIFEQNADIISDTLIKS